MESRIINEFILELEAYLYPFELYCGKQDFLNMSCESDTVKLPPPLPLEGPRKINVKSRT